MFCSIYLHPLLNCKFVYQLVNKEMFWVVTEICGEHNLVRRMKIIKQFIKIASKRALIFCFVANHCGEVIANINRLFEFAGQCKECKNFNSMFALIGGLGHGAVSRLRASWEKLPSKYQKLYEDMEDLMDPSRNMSKYRNLINSEQVQFPIVSCYFFGILY